MTNFQKPQDTLDSLLDDIGHQFWNLFVLGLPILSVSALSLIYIFTTAELKYRCAIPECESISNTSYITPWLHNAVPFNEDGSPQTCFRYTSVSGTSGCNQPSHFNLTDVRKCDSWVYATDEVNILNEFNLQCDENKWKLAFVGTIDGFGSLLGLPICGFLTDRFGRRFTLKLFSFVLLILGLLQSFSTTYEEFVFFEFSNAFLIAGVFSSAYILSIEIVSAKQRVFANIFLHSFYPAGDVVLGFAAMYINNWRWLLRILYGYGLIFLLLYWTLPESMRWLISKKRNAEAVKVVEKIVKNHPNAKNLDIDAILKSTDKVECYVSILSEYAATRILNLHPLLQYLLIFCAKFNNAATETVHMAQKGNAEEIV